MPAANIRQKNKQKLIYALKSMSRKITLENFRQFYFKIP